MSTWESVVIGSGPNGLAAAIACAKAGQRTLLLEANETLGGGARTEELTLPGFRHDIGSAVHPLAIASPFFRELPLESHGLKWIHGPAQAAQTLGDDAVLLLSSVDETAEGLDREDRAQYRRLMAPLAKHWEELFDEILQPITHLPKHPFLLARFGANAIWPASSYLKTVFRGARAQALLGGIAAHANAPLSTGGTGAVAMMLTLAAHARGWPIPQGGAEKIIGALAAHFRELGGTIQTGERVSAWKEIPPAKRVFFDLTPRQIARLAGDELAPSHRSAMETYALGPGVFKLDWALSAPIPWKNSALSRAPTVHIAADLAEIEKSELEVSRGRVSDRPYILLSQPTVFDASRAPQGKHIAWAYIHVPNGSTFDSTSVIENQIERFAPGFRDIVLARHTSTPATLEAQNANLIGGDISGGVFSLKQLLFRPALKLNAYKLPFANAYICSSSTPPGPGVHGMCGYNAVLSSGLKI